MMKKSLTLFIALGTLAFTACSDLGVSDSKAVEGNYPDGFTVAEYSALHPQLKNLQIADYVNAYNKGLTLDDAAIAADTAAFFADTASLHQIFVNYAGYTESLWTEDWTASTSTEKVCPLDTVSISVKPATEKAFAVYLGTITYDATGAITAVTGHKDSTLADVEETYTIDGTTYSLVKLLGSVKTKVDSTKCVDKEVTSLGEVPKDQKKYLLNYNFNDNLNDLAALAQVPLDSEAISLQYLMYGQAHGWAYRACSDLEKANPIQTETYPATKLYCADGDIIREIAE